MTTTDLIQQFLQEPEETETFKEIKDFPGYWCDALEGKIYTYRRGHNKKPLSNKLSQNGYVMACLYNKDKMRVANVGRIMLETFCPCEGMEQLDAAHLDNNPQNNRLSNMKWMTRSQNVQGRTYPNRYKRMKPIYVVYNDEDRTIEYFKNRLLCPIQCTTISHLTSNNNSYRNFSKKYNCWIYTDDNIPEEYKEKVDMIKQTIKELDLDSFSIRMEPRNHKPYKRGDERIPYGTGPYSKKNKTNQQ